MKEQELIDMVAALAETCGAKVFHYPDRISIVVADGGSSVAATDFCQKFYLAASTPLLERIAQQQQEIHNLNWALGTEGYEQMATPEQQAEHEAAVASINESISNMGKRKTKFDAMQERIDELTGALEKASRLLRSSADPYDEACTVINTALQHKGQT